MHGSVRVVVWHDAAGCARELEQTYHGISRRLAGTPGLLRNELWRSLALPDRYAVVSEWADLAAFRAWADDVEQHRVTWPLRRFRPADARFEIYHDPDPASAAAPPGGVPRADHAGP